MFTFLQQERGGSSMTWANSVQLKKEQTRSTKHLTGSCWSLNRYEILEFRVERRQGSLYYFSPLKAFFESFEMRNKQT